MGFFDKLRGKNSAANWTVAADEIAAPLTGRVMPLEEVPDETFAEGLLGPGCGIEQEDDTLYAPFDATVTQLPDSRHAVGLQGDGGIEMLLHVGMDTVEMNGRGFTALVARGDRVKAGTPLLRFDRSAIAAAGHPATTAVIVTNADECGEPTLLLTGSVQAGQTVMRMVTKR